MNEEEKNVRRLTAAEARAAIAALRPKIDEADAAALAALAERTALVAEVGRIKAAAGLPVLDPAREAAILERVEAKTGERAMRAVWRVVMAAARAAEQAEGAAACAAAPGEKAPRDSAEEPAEWRVAWPAARGGEAPSERCQDLLAMLLALGAAPLELSQLAGGALRLRLEGGMPEALAKDLAERGAVIERMG